MKTNLFKSLLATFMIVVSTNVAYGSNKDTTIIVNGLKYELNKIELTAAVSGLSGAGNYVKIDSIVTDNNNKQYRVTSIKEGAINSQNMKWIRIPKSITEIADGNFSKNKCTSLSVIANGCCYADIDTTFLVKYLDDSVTPDNYIIKEGTKWIGHGAFVSGNVTKITIPSSVINIHFDAFYYCRNLTNVEILSEVPAKLSTGVFEGTEATINVPCGTLEAYKTAWSSYESRIQYKSLPYQINGSVNDSTMGSIYVPIDICDSTPLSAIPNNGYEFVRWSDGNTENPRIIELTQDTTLVAEFAKTCYITFESDSIMGKIIGKNTAFDGEVVTLDVMPNYGYRFIQWSDGITETPRDFTITCDTTIIAEFEVEKSGTCGHNNSLTWEYDDQTRSLYISGNGALNENYTFGVEAPNVMEHIIIEEGVTSIGNKAFCNVCSNVRSLELTDVTTIGDSAFTGAKKLRTINFGSSLEEIGKSAFSNCKNVREMTCSTEDVPFVAENAIKDINSSAKLYVPENSINYYETDNDWGRFDIQGIQGIGERTEISNEIMEVRSVTTNEATIAWPVYEEAESYTLEITKDGEVVCTLIFNSFGQLTGIAFVPSKNGNHNAPSATLTTTNGMQFTVTNLESGTNYKVQVDVRDENQNSLKSFVNEFSTESDEEGIEMTSVSTNACKIIRNGQVFIQLNDKTYTLQGQLY